MKILAVSDLHYSLPQFEWLVHSSDHYDLVVIAGDLIDLASPVDVHTQIIVISRYLEQIRTRTALAVCSGNHDGDTQTEGGEFAAEWLKDLSQPGLGVDGDTMLLGDAKVTICPWWESAASRQAMIRVLERDAPSSEPRPLWIWLHHNPPDLLPVSWTGKAFAGDPLLNELILSLHPDIVFSGHIHNAPFYSDGGWASQLGSTWIFNPGHQIGRVPSAIVVDLPAMTADYLSLESEEHRDLRSPGNP